MDAKKGENDRDSSRAFKWIAIIATLLIIGAVLFNVAWFKGRLRMRRMRRQSLRRQPKSHRRKRHPGDGGAALSFLTLQ